jgi:hypothetical protein
MKTALLLLVLLFPGSSLTSSVPSIISGIFDSQTPVSYVEAEEPESDGSFWSNFNPFAWLAELIASLTGESADGGGTGNDSDENGGGGDLEPTESGGGGGTEPVESSLWGSAKRAAK